MSTNENMHATYTPRQVETLYFAGGCFWGVQAFFERMPGVLETAVGFVDVRTLTGGGSYGAECSKTGKELGVQLQAQVHGELKDENDKALPPIGYQPTYEEVCQIGYPYIETVQVRFDPDAVSCDTLKARFGQIVDLGRLGEVQGPDVGFQYTTGVWGGSTEVNAKIGFSKADQSHQEYLQKNPGGYCHIPLQAIHQKWSLVDKALYRKEPDNVLREHLSDEQYRVTQLADTETPFTGEYENTWEPGIYVDVASGEPLFLSSEKYDSGCGWPAFSKPIDSDVVEEFEDDSIIERHRVEVRSSAGSHLGHVFQDGVRDDLGEQVDLSADPNYRPKSATKILPQTRTGLRYCINSAALRFVPLAKMEELGYGWLISFVQTSSN